MSCRKKNLEFSTNDDFVDPPECYFQEKFDISYAKNPLNLDETCKLLTNKKLEYYIYDYNPQRIIDKLIKINTKESITYLNNLEKTFDLTKRTNCCNCVSVVLYSTNPLSLISNYLQGLNITIENVTENLPEFLIRVYLDPSVFEQMEKYQYEIDDQQTMKLYENGMNILNKLITYPNIEIYSYFCQSLIENPIKGRLRSFRFLSFVDPEVNCCCLRDSDSFVSKLDCHNLKSFLNYDTIFYCVPQYNTGRLPGEKIMTSYAWWLVRYKKVIDRKFFLKKTNLMDLKAGMLTTKLQVKRDVYNKMLKKVEREVENDIEGIYKDSKDIKGHQKSKLNFNYFDEIFLLNLFRNQICVSYKSEKGFVTDYNMKEASIVTRLINFINIKTYYVNSLNVKSIINSLKRENVIKKNVKIPNILKSRDRCFNLNEDPLTCTVFGTLFAIDIVLTSENIIENKMFDIIYENDNENNEMRMLDLVGSRYNDIFLFTKLPKDTVFNEEFMNLLYRNSKKKKKKTS